VHQRDAATPQQQQQQHSWMDVPPWREQLLQRFMPGALQVQLMEQPILLTPFVALLRKAQDAQRKLQQQDQQQEAAEPSEAGRYFNMLLLPMLMELLLLRPSDVALAYNVLLLAHTAMSTGLMGARHMYVWTRVMQSLLQQLGPLLVKMLSSSTSSTSSISCECDDIRELQLAFGKLMALLTDSGGPANRHTGMRILLFV
jgi:hypothetical protein